MHVGDSLESDVQGARGVGAVSVWLNRDQKPRESDVIPDFEIQSLTKLDMILNRSREASK